MVALDGIGIGECRSSWKTLDIKDGFEVTVAFDEAQARSLEVGFGELGFNEEGVELEIDLGTIFQGFGLVCLGCGGVMEETEAGLRSGSRLLGARAACLVEWHTGMDAEFGLSLGGYA